MTRNFLLLSLLVLIGGCKTMGYMGAGGPINSLFFAGGEEIGVFQLDQNSSNLDDLLDSFRKNAPDALKGQGLDNAYFSPDKGRQWGVLTFKHRFIHWRLGVQFVRVTETSTAVLALIRATGTVDGQTPNPQRLQEILGRIAEGLQVAQRSP